MPAEEWQLTHALPHANFVTLQGFVGLNNLGKTCYANSIVQCLMAIPQLVSHFVQLTASVGQGNDHTVSGAFGELVQQMCTSNGPLSPSS